MLNGLVSAGRSSLSTLMTPGMTSPRFSMRTVSPTRMSFRAISSSLCSVARLIVEPSRNTGSSSATGVSVPVRPTWTVIALSLVCVCSGAYLKAMAQRGALAVAPTRSRRSKRFSLMTAPSVS